MSDNSQGSGETKKQVIDFNQARTKRLDDKRRKTERIFFKHLLNVYSVAVDSSLRAIEFIDISEEGCSFQVSYDPTNPWPKDLSEIPLRLYFSQDTYLEIRAVVQNSTPYIDKDTRCMRFGCKIDKTTASYGAYKSFVHFMNSYSEHAHKDVGNSTLFYL